MTPGNMSFRATKSCHSEQREEPAVAAKKRVPRLRLGMTPGNMSFRATKSCHSEQREEPAVALKSRSFASLRMTSGVVSIPDHHVLAKLVLELTDDEIGRGLCRQSPGLHTLDAFEGDRVVLSDLRVIRHEARVF